MEEEAECEFCGDKLDYTQQCTFCGLFVHKKCLDNGLCLHCCDIIKEQNHKPVIKLGV